MRLLKSTASVLIPTLSVMLEERLSRRAPAMRGAPALQGDIA
jgi:hypothetical protein